VVGNGAESGDKFDDGGKCVGLGGQGYST
jgi:hypothetical protein